MSDNVERTSPVRDAVAEGVAMAVDIAQRTCPECLRVFGSAKALWGHSWVHKPRKDRIPAMEPPSALLLLLLPAPPPPGGGLGWRPWTINSTDERDRTCPTCNTVFASPKAMYGHLHVHQERRPRSVVPPVVQDQAIVVDVMPLAPPPEEEGWDENGEGNSPLSIDLNRSVWDDEEEEGGDGDSPHSIDLNRTPPSK